MDWTKFNVNKPFLILNFSENIEKPIHFDRDHMGNFDFSGFLDLGITKEKINVYCVYNYCIYCWNFIMHVKL